MRIKSTYSVIILALTASMGCTSVINLDTKDKEKEVAAVDESTIKNWINSKILTPEGESLSAKEWRYLVGSADLNRDGLSEYMVLMQDHYFCGSGGCTAFIFNHLGEVISRMSVTDTPILLSEQQHYGWQDFIVWSNGHYRLMRYNGSQYPSNPSTQPIIERQHQEQKAMQAIMQTELYQQDGYNIQAENITPLWQSEHLHRFTFNHYGDPENNYHATIDMKNGDIDIEIKPKN